jgi:hypothetical protein
LSNVAVIAQESRTLATDSGAVQLYGARVSPALFRMRGVAPLLGRGLLAEEERPDADTIVLVEAAWREHRRWPGLWCSAATSHKSVPLLSRSLDRVYGGPGGWLFLDEPELHFGNDVLVPDIAAWRRTRLPAFAPEPYLTLAPDWVCEVLSPSTEKLDRGEKLRVYARERVEYVWLIDPLRQTLEVLALDQRGRWTNRGSFEGRANVRAAPFDAVELELGALWI